MKRNKKPYNPFTKKVFRLIPYYPQEITVRELSAKLKVDALKINRAINDPFYGTRGAK